MAAMASSLSLERVSCRLVCRSPSQAPSVSRVAVSAKLGNAEKAGSTQGVVAKIEKMAGKHMQVLSIVAANAMLVLPALAEEEKGSLFDFNLTLPIISVEFLLTMYALNKIWFEPVSKVMDSRDEEIRKKLVGVRDNSDEIKQLQSEAESVLKAARVETALQAAKMKKELAEELDAKLQGARSRMEKELDAALANLEQQRLDTLKSLDSQVSTLSDEIVQKLIPFKA